MTRFLPFNLLCTTVESINNLSFLLNPIIGVEPFYISINIAYPGVYTENMQVITGTFG